MAQLTLQDLRIMVQFIDVSTKRGAVEGQELATVGQLRNNIADVIANVEAQEAQARVQAEREAAENEQDSVDTNEKSE